MSLQTVGHSPHTSDKHRTNAVCTVDLTQWGKTNGILIHQALFRNNQRRIEHWLVCVCRPPHPLTHTHNLTYCVFAHKMSLHFPIACNASCWTVSSAKASCLVFTLNIFSDDSSQNWKPLHALTTEKSLWGIKRWCRIMDKQTQLFYQSAMQPNKHQISMCLLLLYFLMPTWKLVFSLWRLLHLRTELPSLYVCRAIKLTSFASFLWWPWLLFFWGIVETSKTLF